MPTLLDRIRSALGTRYLIERELGGGGMATVYLAHDQKHGRPVAVKVLRPELASSIGPERFLREIQMAARLTHPHILPLHDSGEVEGLLYYVMPYIEGESLRDHLQREHRLELDQALQLGREVADALDYAHQHGVVHRDIKPENILIANGQAVVADFGIARAVSSGGELLTEAGFAVGTPMYMSPEQVEGDPDLDGRSDIYSLGCVLFEALTGVPPFQGRSAQAILLRRLTESPAALRTLNPEMPAAVEAAIARALSREPADRFATAAGLSSALTDAARHGGAPGPDAMVSGPQPIAEASVAVLPFLNLSSDPENEYFSDGMTDEVINALAQIPGLRVPARSSCFMFKGKNVDARQIGERLKVRTLLEGRLRKAGDRIRLTVQLINASDGYHLWSHTYERTLADVFALQDELTRAIVSELTSRMVGTATNPVRAVLTALPLPGQGTLSAATGPTTRDPEAYTLYLRGRYAALKRTDQGFALGIEYLEQATERDPSYALAYAALAECWLMRGFGEYGSLSALLAMPKARAAALEAQRLTPRLPEPHLWLGAVRLLFDWDLPGAESAIRHAIELGPSQAHAQAWYAIHLAVLHRFGEALQYARRAQALEPLSLTMQLVTGRILYWSGRVDEAVELLEAMRLAEPGHASVATWLARALAVAGRPAEAIGVLTDLPERVRDTYVTSVEARIRVLLGEEAEARALCASVEESVGPGFTYVAAARAALGDTEQAVAVLEQLLAQRSGLLVFAGLDSLFEELRRDPRTAAILKRVGVPLE